MDGEFHLDVDQVNNTVEPKKLIKFVIEIRGLPKFRKNNDLKRFMNEKLKLKAYKIKRPNSKSTWALAIFKNEANRDNALSILNGNYWKGNLLCAETIEPCINPLLARKQKRELDRFVDLPSEEGTQEERLMNAIMPLWKIPYAEQMKIKQEELKENLRNVDSNIYRLCEDQREEIEIKRKLYSGIAFDVRTIMRSPVTEGYRNRCGFTIGIDVETNLPTIGLKCKGRVNTVVPINAQLHISEEIKDAVLFFQKYIRNSDLPPYSEEEQAGYWRYLTVRHSKMTGEVLLVLAIFKMDLSEEAIASIKMGIRKFLTTDEAMRYHIKALYFELIYKRAQGERPEKAVHVWGQSYITDSILGKNFLLSSDTFFEINTAGATILFENVIDMSELEKDTTVINICCGSGTIALCVADLCKKVYAMDSNAAAVNDAKENAQTNYIKNCEFLTGKAEEILPTVLERPIGNVVAIVYPPRSGLFFRTLALIRNSWKINRVVYICCSTFTAMKNILDLTRPPNDVLTGPPYVPVRVNPVDMLPHTKHVQFAILFERVPWAMGEASSSATTNVTQR